MANQPDTILEGSGTLGIVAGGGALPLAIAGACREIGRPCYIVGIKDEAEKAIEAYPHAWLGIGALGHAITALKQHDCEEVVIAGPVRRPNFSALQLDSEGAKLLPKLISRGRVGDDALLSLVVQAFESKGLKIVGADDVMANLLAPTGTVGSRGPGADDLDDIQRAVEVTRAMGALDIGQGAVVCDGLVLAVESAEGTDAMLDRVAQLPEALRGTVDQRRGVLVKLTKPGQERRVDLPTIGTGTIEKAGIAGLAGVAVEAGGALVMDRAAVIRAADDSGLFVLGISPEKFAPTSAGVDLIPEVMIVAGEPSGDLLGAQLMQSVRELTGGAIAFSGVGGPAMERAGFQSLFPMSDIAVMGLGEIVPRLPRILTRIRQTARAIADKKPSALVIIDSPDFTHRVAKRVHHLVPQVPVINYVPPQVWAWRRGRVRKMARYIDHVLTLLPFEPEVYKDGGPAGTFVGHPVVERRPAHMDRQAFRTGRGIPTHAPLLMLLPGSRSSEVNHLAPLFKAAAEELAARVNSLGVEGLHIAVPVVPHLRVQVEAALAGLSMPVHFVEKDEAKWQAFAAADAALSASGTVLLELALAGVPMVAAYKVNPLTAAIARRLISVPNFTLVNLILGREVIPELLQEACTPQALADAVYPLLMDKAAAGVQRDALAKVAQALGAGQGSPSMQAARTILDVIDEKARATSI